MPYENLGFVNRKTTKSGNDVLSGKIKLPDNVRGGDEIKIMINMSKPTKNNGYSVAQMIDDPNYKGRGAAEAPAGKKSTLF